MLIKSFVDGKGLTVEGSVKASVMKTAGEHEVEVHGNILDSTIENYESNKDSDLSGKELK